MNPTFQANHWAGRLWMAGMGLFLAAAGAFFAWYLWKNFAVAGEMNPWVETPCTIIASAVDGSKLDQHFQTQYEFQVSYRYEWRGESRLGDHLKSKPVISGIRKKLEKWEARYPAGVATVCFVDPSDPARAVLVRDTKASIFSLWFPGIFVVGGLGLAISALFAGLRPLRPAREP